MYINYKKKARMYVLYFATPTLKSNSVFSIWLVGDDVKEKKPDPSIYLTASNVILTIALYYLNTYHDQNYKMIFLAEAGRVTKRLFGSGR